MAIMDPIADLLTRIRNAILAKHTDLEVSASSVKKAIVNILYDEGYIKKYKLMGEGYNQKIKIFLKYDNKKSCVISGLKRVSKSSRRLYVKKKNMPYVLEGLGIAIISTSKGIITDRESRRDNLGGEVMCYIW